MVALDHRALRLVECGDLRSAALFNALARTTAVKVNWRCETACLGGRVSGNASHFGRLAHIVAFRDDASNDASNDDVAAARDDADVKRPTRRVRIDEHFFVQGCLSGQEDFQQLLADGAVQADAQALPVRSDDCGSAIVRGDDCGVGVGGAVTVGGADGAFQGVFGGDFGSDTFGNAFGNTFGGGHAWDSALFDIGHASEDDDALFDDGGASVDDDGSRRPRRSDDDSETETETDESASSRSDGPRSVVEEAADGAAAARDDEAGGALRALCEKRLEEARAAHDAEWLSIEAGLTSDLEEALRASSSGARLEDHLSKFASFQQRFQQQLQQQFQQQFQPEVRTGQKSAFSGKHACADAALPLNEALGGEAEVERLEASILNLTAQLRDKDDELELVYSTFNPTLEAQRAAQQKLIEARAATLEVARKLDDSSAPHPLIPVKIMGQLDPVALARAGMGVDEISSLQQRLCTPNFHPMHVLVENGIPTSTIDENNPELVSLRCDYGAKCVGEVVRCFLELEEWNPSGRYAVRVPWDTTKNKEMPPSQIIRILGTAAAARSGACARPGRNDHVRRGEEAQADLDQVSLEDCPEGRRRAAGRNGPRSAPAAPDAIRPRPDAAAAVRRAATREASNDVDAMIVEQGRQRRLRALGAQQRGSAFADQRPHDRWAAEPRFGQQNLPPHLAPRRSPRNVHAQAQHRTPTRAQRETEAQCAFFNLCARLWGRDRHFFCARLWRRHHFVVGSGGGRRRRRRRSGPSGAASHRGRASARRNRAGQGRRLPNGLATARSLTHRADKACPAVKS
ncbi:hypothetical protein M885DRAFT_525411 [Pelagophyceae sp. CCMP2097]|nr:hypothetical protein M885DRAFT_525411 [Pelagophyceae sp. CCMP2097]